MSKKKAVPVSKDRSQHSLDRRTDASSKEKIRILQDNLVFVNSLPSDIASKEILLSPEYFSRYGTVTKLILNPPQPQRKGVTYQAYVTYSSHLEASLAIVALDGFILSERPLKVSFGTTKYCSHFLRGNECSNPDCFYLHQIYKEREVSSGDTRTIFKQQNAKALTHLLENLPEVAGKALDSRNQTEDEGFPSITETLDYLVKDQEEILASELEHAYSRAKSEREPDPQPPILDNRVQSLAQPRQRQKQFQKLGKSSFNSTMCTPMKQESPATMVLRRKQEGPEEGKENVGKQKSLGGRELSIQQKIEKRIIKEIWKKNHSETKSRFVQGITTSREECTRLRGIVQKFLIATN